jgi:hypothetical protein
MFATNNDGAFTIYMVDAFGKKTISRFLSHLHTFKGVCQKLRSCFSLPAIYIQPVFFYRFMKVPAIPFPLSWSFLFNASLISYLLKILLLFLFKSSTNNSLITF